MLEVKFSLETPLASDGLNHKMKRKPRVSPNGDRRIIDLRVAEFPGVLPDE